MRGKGIVSCFFGLNELCRISFKNLKSVAVERHPAFIAIEKIADGIAALAGDERAFTAGLQAPNFKHKFLVAIVEARKKRVRRFLVVLINVFAAARDSRRGKVYAQAPPRDIHFVNALVADISVASVPKPVPVVKEMILAEWNHGRGTAELVPVDAGRNGLIWRVTDGFASLETESFGHVDLADRAILQQLSGFDFMCRAPALRAHLHHAFVFPRSGDHLAAFPRVVASGLFDVNVLTSLACPDGGQRVPVVG